MEDNQTKVCPKCSSPLQEPPYEHFNHNCLQKSSIQKLMDKGVIFIDESVVCLRCLKQFDKKGWSYHQKKIRSQCLGYSLSERALSSPSKHIGEYEERLSEGYFHQSSEKRLPSEKKDTTTEKKAAQMSPSSKFFGVSLFSDKLVKSAETIPNQRQFPDALDISVLLLQEMTTSSKIPLISWVKQNYRIKSIYLHQFFRRFLEKTFRNLRNEIKQPTFEFLQEQGRKNKWRKLLKDPSDIFDQDTVRKSVQSLAPSTRNKVLRCLNKVYKQFYDDIFPKFVVQTVIPVKKRSQLPLKTKDFFRLLEMLFATKERDMVHIAIDFYILFQSPQRVGSDRENIEKGILHLIQDRKTDKNICQFEMEVKKTFKAIGKASKFIVSQQLCQLIEAFGWVGFYKQAAIYKRMRNIFGFPVYSIKHCVFAEFERQKIKEASLDLQALANHKTKTAAKIYAKFGIQSNEKDIKDNLRIPNLTICPISRQSLYKFLGKTQSFRRYTRIKNDWLERLRLRLRNYNKDLCNFYDSKEGDLNEEEANGNFESQSQEKCMQQNILSKEEKYANSNEQLSKIPSKVKIEAFFYSFQGKRFKFHELFSSSSINYCGSCTLYQATLEMAQGMICMFCSKHYHNQCLPQLFCSCITPQYCSHLGIPFESKKKSQLKLLMPEEYLLNNQQFLNQIVFLLAARRFLYTPTAIAQEVFQIDERFTANLGVQKLNLPNYQVYTQGKYFPPLYIDVSGNETPNGTGFGLFAAEDIPKNCFIGEYAADILPSSSGIFVRRPDSIFTLVSGDRPENTLIIGPSRRCSYACLINGSEPQYANCSSQKVEINGLLKIIIYSRQKIKKGEELCYNYDINSIFSSINLKKKTAVPLNPQIQAKNYPYCGLTNLGNTCYMNSTLQFFRIMFGTHVSKEQSKVQDILFEILETMKVNRVFKPEFYLKQLVQVLQQHGNHLSLDREEDAHELILAVLNQMSQTIKNMCKIEVQTILICYKCKQQTTTSSFAYTLQVQLTEDWAEKIYSDKTQEDIQCLCEQPCGANRKKKIERIVNFPEKLIIVLKRFDKNLRKISDNVEVPERLYQYELKSIINHQGTTISTGHYTAMEFVDDCGLLLNDQVMNLVHKEADQRECYLLGYQTKEND